MGLLEPKKKGGTIPPSGETRSGRGTTHIHTRFSTQAFLEERKRWGWAERWISSSSKKSGEIEFEMRLGSLKA